MANKYPCFDLDIERLEKRIKQAMRNQARDFDNCTKLAESVAADYLVDQWLDDDIHPIWDWAMMIWEDEHENGIDDSDSDSDEDDEG